MELELVKKKLLYGIILVMAISSRFLLNFREGIFFQILSFFLLFSLFSALIYWLKQYREYMPEKKLTLGKVVYFSFQLFVIAAVFSSIVKYFFFMYVKPLEFQMIMNQTVDFMLKEAKYPPQMVKESVSFFTPANFAIMSGLINVFAGVLMSCIVWPLLKREQESTSYK